MIRSLFFPVFLFLWLSAPLYAATYTMEDDLIGEITYYTVREEDNLYTVARRFDIGIVELLSANPGVDPWKPKAGTRLKITTMHVLPEAPRAGLVLNLPELRLFYFPGDGTVMTFPIGIGKEGWETPTGATAIAKKRENPAWIPPASIREENPDLPDIVPPGPDNPMGNYALNLGWPGYAIHGTNRPYGIGKRSSHGCIRLYPEDIKVLFNAVEVGMPVIVIDTPYKLGWRGNTLFLEVTPTQEQTDVIARYGQPVCVGMPGAYDAIRRAASDALIDWYAAEEIILRQDGIPAAIGTRRTLPERRDLL